MWENATKAAMEALFTMAPPLASRAAISYFMHQNTARTFVRHTDSMSSVVSSWNGLAAPSMPALLKAPSSRPKRLTAASTASRTAGSSVTSTGNASACPPWVRICVTRASQASSLRAPSTTLALALPSAKAVAAPIPEDAPVTG